MWDSSTKTHLRFFGLSRKSPHFRGGKQKVTRMRRRTILLNISLAKCQPRNQEEQRMTYNHRIHMQVGESQLPGWQSLLIIFERYYYCYPY